MTEPKAPVGRHTDGRRPKSPTLQRRNQDIIARFKELYKKGFRTDVICKKVAEEFYLAPNYVFRIVKTG